MPYPSDRLDSYIGLIPPLRILLASKLAIQQIAPNAYTEMKYRYGTDIIQRYQVYITNLVRITLLAYLIV